MTLFEDGFFHVMKEHDIQKRLPDLVESSLLKEFMWGVVKSHLQPKFLLAIPQLPCDVGEWFGDRDDVSSH